MSYQDLSTAFYEQHPYRDAKTTAVELYRDLLPDNSRYLSDGSSLGIVNKIALRLGFLKQGSRLTAPGSRG